jgi:hypothetical protein
LRLIALPLRSAALAAALSALLAACSPAEPNAPAAQSDPDGMLGAWSVEFRGGDGVAYVGTLDVLNRTGPGTYRGDLKLGYTDSTGADKGVEEDASIEVHGNHVAVTCSKPVVLTEDSDYVPDNFYLTRQGRSMLKGYEKDVAKIDGTVTLTRQAGVR